MTDPETPAQQFKRQSANIDRSLYFRRVLTAAKELKTLVQVDPWMAHNTGNLAQLIRDAENAQAFLADTDTPPDPHPEPKDAQQEPSTS